MAAERNWKAEFKTADDNIKAKQEALRKAKHATPQDLAVIERAKSDLENAKLAKESLREEEKAYNQKSKSKALNKTTQPAQSQDMHTQEQLNQVLPQFNPDQNTQDAQNTQATQNQQQSLGNGFFNTLATGTYQRDFGANYRGQPTGNTLDASSKTFKEQAQNYRNRAAERDMEAQKAQQFGDQNAYSEAGKIASVQNDAQNRQNVRNSKSLGSSAGLQRETNTPDVQQQKQFSAQQRDVANKQRAEADTAREEATGAEGDSEQDTIKSRDYNEDINESARLSLGNERGSSAWTQTEQTSQVDQTPAKTEQQPAPENQTKNIGSLQNIINASSASSVRRTDDGNGNIAGWRVNSDGSIVSAPEYNRGDPSKAPPYTAEMEQQVQALAKSGKYGKQEGESQEAWTQRVNGELGRGGNADSAAFYQNQGRQIESDSRVKNIRQVLSDMKMKWIKEDFDKYGRPDKDDLMWLMSQIKDRQAPEDNCEDTVLNDYAQHIRNYVYTYKPEATEIDPSIDPEQEHIGPMAQDIEQVNPACIQETPEGVKTVDTARLAMMNAGAIGDLARQMQELTNVISQLTGE